MSKTYDKRDGRPTGSRDALEKSPMMAHLLDGLDHKTDIGEYGRLTFTMVARFFLSEDEMVHLLKGQPGMNEETARALVLQVKRHDYNPPKRERVLQWQQQQDFQICPDEEDPNSCNVYKELEFPQELYDRIGEFWEDKSEAAETRD